MRYVRERRFWKKQRRESRLDAKFKNEDENQEQSQAYCSTAPSSTDSAGDDIVPDTSDLLMYLSSDDNAGGDASSTGSEETVRAMARKFHGVDKLKKPTATATTTTPIPDDQPGPSTSAAQPGPSTSAAQPGPSTSATRPNNATQTVHVSQSFSDDEGEDHAVQGAPALKQPDNQVRGGMYSDNFYLKL